VDSVATPVSDDVDLDALMLRVRDAAMTSAASAGTVQPQAAADGAARELDLVRVLEAQGDWNEQARQSFTALLEGIRALRDDWAEAQTRLRQEIVRLSALVEQLRATPSPGRRAAASPRGRSKRRQAGKRRARR
jgi:hypothetical protein